MAKLLYHCCGLIATVSGLNLLYIRGHHEKVGVGLFEI